MLKTARAASIALILACAVILARPLTAAAPTAKPEDVGLSSDRLKRVAELVQRHVAAGSFSGAVTLVARNGRIAHHEAQGLMDLDAKKPMPKDGIFRIMSMTKPVVGVAILMMMEEGKVRLQDPVSKFIPEWKNMTVGVPQAAAPGARAGGAAPAGRAGGPPPEPRFYTVPVEREVQVRDLLTHTSGVVSGTDQQLRQSRRRGRTERDAGRLHSATRQGAAGVPARHALGLQRRRWIRRAVADRGSRLGHADRSLPQAASLRSARDEGHQLHRPHRQPAARDALHARRRRAAARRRVPGS